MDSSSDSEDDISPLFLKQRAVLKLMREEVQQSIQDLQRISKVLEKREELLHLLKGKELDATGSKILVDGIWISVYNWIAENYK